MTESQTRLPVEIVVYCADCDKDWAEGEERYLGVRVCCENNSHHLASIVKGKEGRRWLRLESKLLHYQSGYSPGRYFKHYEEYYVLGRMIVLVVLLWLALCLLRTTIYGCILSVILALLVLYLIIDIMVINTSIAFTSRSPANPLRTTILALLSFFSIPLAFSVLFALMPSYFIPPLDNFVRVIYFSLITIATVGYGDIKPNQAAWLPQILIIVEIILGVYFLAILLAIISNWSNNRSLYSDIKPLYDVHITGSEANSYDNSGEKVKYGQNNRRIKKSLQSKDTLSLTEKRVRLLISLGIIAIAILLWWQKRPKNR